MYSKHASTGFFGKAREAMKDPASWMALSALTPLVGAGVGLGYSGVQAIANRVSLNRSYKEMFEHNPELKQADPKEVRRMFSTLERFGPELAKDPAVAGAWIHSTLVKNKTFSAHGRNTGLLESTKELVGIGKDLAGMAKSRGDVGGPGRAMATGASLMSPLGSALKGIGEGPAEIKHLRRETARMDEMESQLERLRRHNEMQREMIDELQNQKLSSAIVKKAAARLKHLR